MALTDSWLRSVSGKEAEKMVTKADRDGLSVRVTPKGKVIFQFRYRWDGKAERIDIGTYPATGLKEARELVLFYRGELEQLHNPRVVKQTRILKAVTARTVEDVIREWWEKSMDGVKVNAKLILRSFEIYVFPKIGRYPHNETDLYMWLSLIESLAEKYPSVADKVLQNTKLAHAWGIRRGIISISPLAGISSADLGIVENQGERVLSDDEIRLLFSLIDKPRYNLRNRCIIKLCLLYGNRIGELIKAKVKHFDFSERIWTIPPENHKTGRKSKRPIIRPITDAAEALLRELIAINGDSEYLLPSPSGGKLAQGAHLYIPLLLNKKMAQHFEEYTTWSIHDLRKTMRTRMSEITTPHVAEIMLGHKLPGIWQVYDKHTYLDEQREAYEKWWDKLTKIVYHSPSQKYPA
ncbi:tyrosine-type recombinase/integrase [Morganella morganii]|uniref:tyrosine-type recombinase/integrase n=1 Tax=Morganella morganii TaxID=582 RepID=UPI0034E3F6E6